MTRAAFTLIEMLAVIAIITILCAVLGTAAWQFQEQAAVTAMESEIECVLAAMEDYYADYHMYPIARTELVIRYTEGDHRPARRDRTGITAGLVEALVETTQRSYTHSPGMRFLYGCRMNLDPTTYCAKCGLPWKDTWHYTGDIPPDGKCDTHTGDPRVYCNGTEQVRLWVDTWDQEFCYALDEDTGKPVVKSCGPDEAPGTNDDIVRR